MSLTYSSTYYDWSTMKEIIMRKRAICPRCGWVARFVREECDDEGCWEVYQCTRCLHIFRIKIKK
jgi:ribosomal protein S27AE